jgi:hypothetical protein
MRQQASSPKRLKRQPYSDVAPLERPIARRLEAELFVRRGYSGSLALTLWGGVRRCGETSPARAAWLCSDFGCNRGVGRRGHRALRARGFWVRVRGFRTRTLTFVRFLVVSTCKTTITSVSPRVSGHHATCPVSSAFRGRHSSRCAPRAKTQEIHWGLSRTEFFATHVELARRLAPCSSSKSRRTPSSASQQDESLESFDSRGPYVLANANRLTFAPTTDGRAEPFAESRRRLIGRRSTTIAELS